MCAVVVAGLQASGRTTFCLRRLAATHVRVSKDAHRDYVRRIL